MDLYSLRVVFVCRLRQKPYVNCHNNGENYVTMGECDIKMRFFPLFFTYEQTFFVLVSTALELMVKLCDFDVWLFLQINKLELVDGKESTNWKCQRKLIWANESDKKQIIENWLVPFQFITIETFEMKKKQFSKFWSEQNWVTWKINWTVKTFIELVSFVEAQIV